MDMAKLTKHDFDWDQSYTKQVATYRGLRVEVIQDEDAQNPRRDYDPYGVMVCFHSRYDLGDADHDLRADDYEGWADMAAHLRKDLGARIILPLWLYDHSGLSISADYGDIDPGHWDSGQVGFIFATADWIHKNVAKRITKDVLARVEEGLRASVQEYDSYLRGDCWGFRVIDPEDTEGDEIEDGSCWGFIGDLDESGLLAEARSVADWYADRRDAARATEDFEAQAAADPAGVETGEK